MANLGLRNNLRQPNQHHPPVQLEIILKACASSLRKAQEALDAHGVEQHNDWNNKIVSPSHWVCSGIHLYFSVDFNCFPKKHEMKAGNKSRLCIRPSPESNGCVSFTIRYLQTEQAGEAANHG